VGVVGVAVVGGFWPAVAAAVTASLLLNWFFTPPVHTFTIADPQNILALLLFITVAVSVSSVVHLAARRAIQAARSRADAAALLALAQTVLGGDDTPGAILDHLTATWGGRAELAERSASVGQGGDLRLAPPDAAWPEVEVSADLVLVVRPAASDHPSAARRVAAQPPRPGRDRLRTQAAQAEALAEGNRMRTALLAAVSHDLRTPLASIKASISTLRQTGLELSAADEAALLATTEESADRLNDLIGNLLDMSRLAAGSLEPFLRPASIDEVAPLARSEAESSANVRLVVPDELPLVRTDPGLLERVLANLFANAIAHSPAGRPPVMTARQVGDVVVLDVIDHAAASPITANADVRAVPSGSANAAAARASGSASRWPGLPVGHGRVGDRAGHRRRRPDNARHAARRRVRQLDDGRRPVTRVLVIDDEEPILRALRINLTAHKYEVSTAADGTSGLAAMVRDRPDVLILDLGLPDMEGTQVIGGIRGWSSVPIIVLSAWGQEAAKIAALDAGADDYVTKPFGMGELLARLRVAVRRASPAPDEPVVSTGDITVDLAAKRVKRGGADVRLTPTEWQLLEVLVRNRERLVTQRQLLQEVWGREYGTDGEDMRVDIAHLSRNLEADPSSRGTAHRARDGLPVHVLGLGRLTARRPQLIGQVEDRAGASVLGDAAADREMPAWLDARDVTAAEPDQRDGA
jgi:two-component system sensor histidine kinase KdpD